MILPTLLLLLAYLPPDAAWRFAPALRSLCLSAEVLDVREQRYVLTARADFAGDLQLLSRRAAELDGAPPVTDGERFPSREALGEQLQFNRQYRAVLAARLTAERVPARVRALEEARAEAEMLYHTLDAMRDSRTDYYYVTVRRQALKRLRDELLGPAAYFSGAWPNPVPIQFFRRAD